MNFDDYLLFGKRVLLLNPPISDTLEAQEQDMITSVEPFGLLRLGTYFRQAGCQVDLLDCLHDPSLQGKIRQHVRKTLFCGNREEENIQKDVYHIGLNAEQLALRLATLDPPDIVAVSSIFTWHADTTREAIQVCKKAFPGAKVILGGNFATLCPKEAQSIGADEVFTGAVPGADFLPTAIDLFPRDRQTDFLRMIKGCPFKCSYCVTNLLNRGRVTTCPPEKVYAQMLARIEERNTRVFILFDDYVLYQQSRYLDPFLDLLIQEKPQATVEFALGFSAHMITEAFATRLRAAKVERVILALETISETRSRDMHRPQHFEEFVRAVCILRDHGYQERNLRAYYLIGLPGQKTDEILRAILFMYNLGVTPSLTAYALTPGSGDMARYGNRVRGLGLDELAPHFWQFAHSGMRVRDLDMIYKYFHERFYTLERILHSPTDDPVLVAMQQILRKSGHLPENW